MARGHAPLRDNAGDVNSAARESAARWSVFHFQRHASWSGRRHHPVPGGLLPAIRAMASSIRPRFNRSKPRWQWAARHRDSGAMPRDSSARPHRICPARSSPPAREVTQRPRRIRAEQLPQSGSTPEKITQSKRACPRFRWARAPIRPSPQRPDKAVRGLVRCPVISHASPQVEVGAGLDRD